MVVKPRRSIAPEARTQVRLYFKKKTKQTLDGYFKEVLSQRNIKFVAYTIDFEPSGSQLMLLFNFVLSVCPLQCGFGHFKILILPQYDQKFFLKHGFDGDKLNRR